MRALKLAILGMLLVGVLIAETASARPDAAKADSGTVTLVGAGDIAGPWAEDDLTALLLDGIPGKVFTAGDNAYLEGSFAEYTAWYTPSWGRHKARTRPAAGNHDYEIAGGGNGKAYFDYFNGIDVHDGPAGPRDRGYYSYDLGAWHIVVTNGECSKIGGCGPDSPQVQWLRADLATHRTKCTFAVTHYPRFNSGEKGENIGKQRSQTFWDVFYEYGVDIVVSGDNHIYERFAPQTPTGVYDPDHGVRQFTVGTGGALPGSIGVVKPNSERRIAGVAGVLRLDLSRKGYSWEFVPVLGETETDSGTDRCNGLED